MAEPNRSEPDALKAAPGATGVLRAQPDRAGLDSDFADLAARFAAHSGGGLSAELSADLALEIVLNEIVEQACLATAATGAAVVLPRDGEMMCRASSGHTAPELGARLDTASGLSGECVKTHRTQRCDDVRLDPRADSEASQRLGVRSVMVMPLLRGDELVGVFELFSSRPYAFGDRDEGTLEVLAARVVSNLDRAARAAEPVSEPPSMEAASEGESRREGPSKEEQAENLPSEVPSVESLRSQIPPNEKKLQSEVLTSTEPAHAIVSGTPETDQAELDQPELDRPEFDREAGRLNVATWVLGAAVVACAVLLGVMIGRHLGWQTVTRRARPAVPAAATAPAPAVDAKGTGNAASASAPQAAVKPNSNAAPPPGGLRVYENGREVFRLPPDTGVSADAGTGLQRAASVEPEGVEPDKVMELSPAAAAGSLVRRVEPEYPEAARQQQVQGAVVLEVHIAADGSVEDVQVVSGPEPLAASAIRAVKQWRFKPQVVNGRRAEMQTTVTLNFKLPE